MTLQAIIAQPDPSGPQNLIRVSSYAADRSQNGIRTSHGIHIDSLHDSDGDGIGTEARSGCARAHQHEKFAVFLLQNQSRTIGGGDSTSFQQNLDDGLFSTNCPKSNDPRNEGTRQF